MVAKSTCVAQPSSVCRFRSQLGLRIPNSSLPIPNSSPPIPYSSPVHGGFLKGSRSQIHRRTLQTTLFNIIWTSSRPQFLRPRSCDISSQGRNNCASLQKGILSAKNTCYFSRQGCLPKLLRPPTPLLPNTCTHIYTPTLCVPVHIHTPLYGSSAIFVNALGIRLLDLRMLMCKINQL